MFFADRVKETTTTSGNGTVELAGAASGFQGFVAAGAGGLVVPYVLVDGTAWETGFGTITDATPDTLSRDTLIASSTGSKIVLSGGTTDVFLAFHAAAARGLRVVSHTTDANISGLVNVMHVVTMNSGTPFTADRTYTLPTAANLGDRCGVACVDGDSAYEILLKSGAAGDKINNTDHSSTEWSRLFIAGEAVVFQCIDASGPHWVVEQDGRIPCYCKIRLTGDSNAGSSWREWSGFDEGGSEELFDIGGIMNASDGRITLRRANKVLFFGSFTVNSSTETGVKFNIDPDGTVYTIGYGGWSAGSYRSGQATLTIQQCAADTVYSFNVYCYGSVVLDANVGSSSDHGVSWGCMEIL